MKIIGIDHIQLAMPPEQEAAARRFYGDLLGLPEIPKPASLVGRGGCWFDGPGFGLHLGVQQDFSPARKAHPCWRVDDLPAWFEMLAAAGVQVEPDRSVPGVRRFYAFDPFGNRLEFLQAGDTFLPG